MGFSGVFAIPEHSETQTRNNKIHDNMKKTNLITRIGRFMAMPLAVAAFTACNNETDLVENQMDAVGISVSMSGAAEAVTRATSTLPSGDLKLMYGSLSSDQSATYTASGSSWSSAAPLYWQQLTAQSGSYPFYAVSPANAAMTGVESDQSTASSALASDLLMAYATPAYKANLTLNFNHVLSMVEVNLTNGGGMTDAELSGASLTLGGLQTAYTVSDLAATASGAAATGLQPLKDGANFQFIAPAQELQANGLTMDFTVTINDEAVTYTYKNAGALSLVAGKKTVFNISVSKTELDVTVTVTDWETHASEDVDAEFKAIQIGEFTDYRPMLGDELTLNYLDADNNVPQTATYTYAEVDEYTRAITNSKKDWTCDNPIYWNNIPNDDTYTGKFTAVYTPATVTVTTPVQDILMAEATDVAYGDAINLSLKHSTAKLSFTFAAGTGFTADELAGMTRTLVLSATENGAVITIGTEALHVNPQTLAEGDIVTLTRSNGNAYTVKLADLKDANGDALFGADSEMEAGKHYAIALTVTETAITATAEVIDWADVAGSGELRLSVTPDPTDLSALTEAGILYLQYGTMTAAFTRNSEGIWNDSEPLYWDDINREGYTTNFIAYFSPANYVAGNDYLYGMATAEYGQNVHLTLNHAMAKMTIKIVKGENMTDAVFSALTHSVALKKVDSAQEPNVNDDGTTVINLEEALTDHAITSEETFFVAPQELTDAHIITQIRQNGNAYTLKLADLKDAAGSSIFGAEGKIVGGNHYDVTLTVDDTKVTATVTLKEWNTITGSGEMKPQF